VHVFNPVALASHRSHIAGVLPAPPAHANIVQPDNQFAIRAGENSSRLFSGNRLLDYADLMSSRVARAWGNVSNNALRLFWNCPASFPIKLLDRRQLPPTRLAELRF